MDHAKRAQALFYQGYNCAQAVFCAFCGETALDMETAARLASSFGGGMGRLREVCGAVSGALLALGLLLGYADPEDPAAKTAHYLRVQALAARFRAENGSIVCRELLRDTPVRPGSAPEPRTPAFYASRPCLRLIGEAAGLLEQLLEEEEENA